MKEELINIVFNWKDFDEIMAFMEKGKFETVQDAIMNAIRACTEK